MHAIYDMYLCTLCTLCKVSDAGLIPMYQYTVRIQYPMSYLPMHKVGGAIYRVNNPRRRVGQLVGQLAFLTGRYGLFAYKPVCGEITARVRWLAIKWCEMVQIRRKEIAISVQVLDSWCTGIIESCPSQWLMISDWRHWACSNINHVQSFAFTPLPPFPSPPHPFPPASCTALPIAM